ncbi:C2 domain-containing protein 3 [Gaertneriomyces sp. JEL0708]|nr:C2 domain-containing protein 3 [Gaertneriomyces sp. JEL0708]
MLSPSSIPSPPPLTSLPPKVDGPVHYILNVEVSRIAWTNIPTLGRDATRALGWRVHLAWWGEDGPGTTFHPEYVAEGSSGDYADNKVKSAIPLPRTPSGRLYPKEAVSAAATTSRRTRARYPVRCSKRQLTAYFCDMGSLDLIVTFNDRIMGHVLVNNFSPLVSSESLPIAGVFPIYQFNDETLEAPGAREKVGDLYLSITLETTAAKVASRRLKDSLDSLSQMELSDSQVQAGHPYIGSSKPNMEYSETGLTVTPPGSVEHSAFLESPPTKQLPPADRSHGHAGDTERFALPLLPSPEQSTEESHLLAQARRSSPLVERKGITASGLNVEPFSAESRSRMVPAADIEVSDYTGGAAHVVPSREDASSDLDELYDVNDELSRVGLDDNDDTQSDILEDDLIIQALNSTAGATLLPNSHWGHESSTEADAAVSDTSGSSSDSSRNDSQTVDLSADEQKCRAILGPTRRHSVRARAPSPKPQAQPQPTLPILPIGVLTFLGRVQSICVAIKSLDLIPESVPHNPAMFSVECSMILQSTVAGSVVQTSSATLPRLTHSRIASRRSYDRGDVHGYKVVFEHEEVLPCVFDAPLVERWLQSTLTFKVTASQKMYGVKGMSHREAWTAIATLKYQDLLDATDCRIKACIPVHLKSADADASRLKRLQIYSNASGRISQRSSRRPFIGTLAVTLDLRQEPVTHRAPSPPAPVIPLRDGNNAAVAHDDLEATQSTKISQQVSSVAYYFNLNISTARSLAIPPDVDSHGALLSLSVRLFSCPDTPISTRPIAYRPPFDSETGLIHDPADFGFDHTVPIVLTNDFLEVNLNKPLIVEVWRLGPKGAVLNDRNVADCRQMGEELLGLVRLPQQHLLRLAASTSGQRSTDDLPIMLPDAEYAIIDPFSGNPKGWLKASLALGTWTQIKRLRTPTSTNPPNAPGSFENAGRLPAEAAKTAERISNDEHDVSEISTDEGRSKPVVESNGADTSTDDASVGHIPAECALTVYFHQACGLRALIHQDFARSQAAPSTYVRFRFFPADVAHIAEGDEQRSAIGEGDSEIETEVVTSFAPRYEESITVTLRGIDTAILGWMKTGGEGYGEIWLKSKSSHVLDALLGTFNVPLRDIFRRPHGVVRHWYPVTAVNESKIAPAVHAAINMSLAFKTGFKFGPEAAQANYTFGWTQLHIEILNVSMSRSDFQQHNERRVCARWWCPHSEGGSDFTEELYESPTVKLPESLNDDKIDIPFRYSKVVDLEVTMESMQWFQKQFAVEFWLEFDNCEARRLIGTAYVDLFDLIQDAADSKHSQSKNARNTVLWVQKELPLINPTSADFAGVNATVRIGVSPVSNNHASLSTSVIRRERRQSHGVGNRATDSARQKHRRSTIDDSENYVPIDITVERAMSLPLMTDPFALHRPSPFVETDSRNLVPPSTFVTYEWYPTGDEDKATAVQIVETPIRPAQTQPVWNHTSRVLQAKSKTALLQMKADKTISFKVWHVADLTVGGRHLNGMGRLSSNEKTAELIGTASVGLAGFFGGLREIYGWYHVVDERGAMKGQIMVRIRPLESIPTLLHDICGILNPIVPSGRRPLADACCSIYGGHTTGHGTAQNTTRPRAPWNIDGFSMSKNRTPRFTQDAQIENGAWPSGERERRKAENQVDALPRNPDREDNPSSGSQTEARKCHDVEQDPLRSSLMQKMVQLEQLSRQLEARTDMLRMDIAELGVDTSPTRTGQSHVHPSTEQEPSLTIASYVPDPPVATSGLSPPQARPCPLPDIPPVVATPPRPDSAQSAGRDPDYASHKFDAHHDEDVLTSSHDRSHVNSDVEPNESTEATASPQSKRGTSEEPPELESRLDPLNRYEHPQHLQLDHSRTLASLRSNSPSPQPSTIKSFSPSSPPRPSFQNFSPSPRDDDLLERQEANTSHITSIDDNTHVDCQAIKDGRGQHPILPDHSPVQSIRRASLTTGATVLPFDNRLEEKVDTDDEDIYDILAYRRMAAAALRYDESAPAHSSSYGHYKTKKDSSTIDRPSLRKHPIATYDPFGLRSATEPIGLKGQAISTVLETGSTWRARLAAAKQDAERNRGASKDWRASLSERIGAVSKEEATRIEKIFGKARSEM